MSEESAVWMMFVQNPCFQELMRDIEDIKERSVKDEDSISTQDLTVQIVAEGRGIRKGLDKLLRRIEQHQLS